MLIITTNNIPREIVDVSQLTRKEREEFDFLDQEEIEKGYHTYSFFRYRGSIHWLGDFLPVSDLSPLSDSPFSPFRKWHAYRSDSLWDGLLVRYMSDPEQIVVGSYQQ